MEQMKKEEQSIAYPLGVRYNVGITEGVAGSRNLVKFQAENPSTFTGVNNNVVRIPVSSGSFLDLKNAVLGCTFTNKSGQVATLDGSIACIIQRLRVLSLQGNEIERLDQYGQLHTILDQYSGSLTSLISNCAMDGGARRVSSSVKQPSKAIEASSTEILADGTSITTGAIGDSITIVNELGGKGYMQEECDSLDTNISRSYQMGLKAGFFNPSTAKMLPPNVSFVLELTLASAASCIKTAATPSYEATNFILSVPSVNILDVAAMNRLNERLSRGVSYKCTSFNHHVNTMASGAGPASLQIGDRSLVLKGLISVFRPQAELSDSTKFKLSKRTIQHLDNYQYQIGSSQYPVNQVQIKTDTSTDFTTLNTRLGLSSDSTMNISEAYTECLRVFGGLNSNMGSCVVGAEEFAQSTVNNGCGLIAVDLMTYSDGSVSSGINTASNALPVVLNLQKNEKIKTTYQVDTYAIKEITVMIDSFGQLFSES
jgi:hypothetical protein